MAKNPRIVILYRIAESSAKNSKDKPDYVSNQGCLFNAYKYKGASRLIVFGDCVSEDTQFYAKKMCDEFINISCGGNSESFLHVLDYALENLDHNQIVYFLEDDYIHRGNFSHVMRQGLKKFDYVSMYDHPDKYYKPTILAHTKHYIWQIVKSTTMTFATKVSTLKEDADVFRKYISTGNPPDHYIFSELTQYRTLGTPLPGFATHGETKWLSPTIKWKKYMS